MTSNNEDSVFISHSSSDKEFVKNLYTVLSTNKIKCWSSTENIPPGSRWIDEVARAISSSYIVLLILTESSQKSKYVQNEIVIAIKKEKIIFPVKISDFEVSDSIEFLITGYQYEDLSGINNYMDQIENILENLKKIYNSKKNPKSANNVLKKRNSLKINNKPEKNDRKINYNIFNMAVENFLKEYLKDCPEEVLNGLSKDLCLACDALAAEYQLKNGRSPDLQHLMMQVKDAYWQTANDCKILDIYDKKLFFLRLIKFCNIKSGGYLYGSE